MIINQIDEQLTQVLVTIPKNEPEINDLPIFRFKFVYQINIHRHYYSQEKGFGSSFSMSKYLCKVTIRDERKQKKIKSKIMLLGFSDSCPRKERGLIQSTLNIRLHSANHPDIIVPSS